jgi:hypothetical protein
MMRSVPRIAYLILTTLLITVVACAPSASPDAGEAFATALPNQVDFHQEDQPAGEEHSHLDAAELTGKMQVVLVPTELVVGPNRFAVGLFAEDGTMVHDATVHFHYYDLSDPQQAVLESESDAYRVQSTEGTTTVYAHERRFDRAGDWGVEVEARQPDGSAASSRIGFRVMADSESLSPGEPVPALRTPTLADVDQDLGRLSSADEPNPAFYQQSLHQAISSGKPTLLLFATPAFCQTRFCGPAYETTSALQAEYGDQVNFLHIEVFLGLPNPEESGFKLAPSVEVFGLESEPWVFFIDEQGTILYRVEGLFAGAEIERQIKAHLDL